MAFKPTKQSITTSSLTLRVLTIVGTGMLSASIGFIVLERTLEAAAEANDFTYLLFIITGLLALVGMGTVHAFFVGHQRATEEIAFIHRTDLATGLLSRVGLEHEIERFISYDKESGNLTKAYLIALEFDSIKDINEMYGHEIGDNILRVLAERLSKIVGDLGPVGRVSGSEYVVVLTAGTNERELKVAVDTLIEAMSQPIKVSGVSMAVFGNAGVVNLTGKATKLEVALRCATLARSAARGAGRGTWSIYHPEMSQTAAYRKWLEYELSSALQRNEFTLNYQPQVDSSTNAIVGYEALLRWTHHEKGAIPPGEFIEIAEHCGLIRPIGAWVLRKACIDAMQLPDHMTMSVNVSSVQIMDAEFISVLKRTLSETGLPPHRLELEVTESVVISDFKTVRDRFAAVHSLGCAIAIDDFGTGYSNLTNLSELPFNKLKIDKSFIDRLGNQTKMGSIVSTIVNLANSMGATAIAEGVESIDQTELLSSSGCTLIQGYYYSKPLSLADAQRLGASILRKPSSEELEPFAIAQNTPTVPVEPDITVAPKPEVAYNTMVELAKQAAPQPATSGPSSFENRLAKIAAG